MGQKCFSFISLVTVALLPVGALATQPREMSGTIFALLDKNEWCPGGSVFLDLNSGSYVLHPRLERSACADNSTVAVIEKGRVSGQVLKRVRSEFADASRLGLRKNECQIVISNGGPEILVLSSPVFSDITPENEGCWSAEAVILHQTLFDLFGRQRKP